MPVLPPVPTLPPSTSGVPDPEAWPPYALVVPATPLLVPGASGRADALDGLRRFVTDLVRSAPRGVVLVLADADAARDVGTVPDLGALGLTAVADLRDADGRVRTDPSNPTDRAGDPCARPGVAASVALELVALAGRADACSAVEVATAADAERALVSHPEAVLVLVADDGGPGAVVVRDRARAAGHRRLPSQAGGGGHEIVAWAPRSSDEQPDGWRSVEGAGPGSVVP